MSQTFINDITGKNASLIEKKNNKDTVVLKGREFGDIYISGNVVCSLEIQIEDCDFEGDITIDNGFYHDRFIIKNCRIKNLIIKGGTFKGGLFISSNQLKGGIVFSNEHGKTLAPASVSIENNKSHYISINNQDFEFIGLNNNDCDWITFTNSLFWPETADSKSKKLYSKTKYLSFHLKDGSEFRADHIEVNNLNFYGILHNSEIRFDEVKVEKLSFEGFTKLTSGALNLSRIKPLNNDSKIIISNSFLGNTLFFGCDFKSFNKFIVKNSQLLDISFSNTKWPTTIDAFDGKTAKPFEDSSKHTLHNELRETFRHLKIAASKQGDKFHESLFYRNEMYYLRRTLSFKTHFSTKVSLFLGLISNNHGQNWFYPILWFVAITALIVLALHSASVCSLEFNWHTFFQLLNPAHRFTDLDIPSNFANLSLDFSSRIINSFLIYQTVAAFRKLY